MPSEQNDRRNNGNAETRSWADWKQDVFEAIEELDQACAHARQVIYRLRPLVRPKSPENDEAKTEREQREVASYNNRRRGARRER